MPEEKHEHKTRRFTCDPDRFGPDKYLVRRRFIKTKSIRAIEDAIKVQQDFSLCYTLMSRYIVEWNLDDCETGEPLAQPHDNPEVFDDLDTSEQLTWLINSVFLSPDFQTPR